MTVTNSKGFPGRSAGKESVCNAGDPGLIPGSRRSPGKGIGFPLRYSWASLVAQTVKNPSAMQKTWVQFLGSEDPLEEDMATRFRIPRASLVAQLVKNPPAVQETPVQFLGQ